jgi:hypothetical protein
MTPERVKKVIIELDNHFFKCKREKESRYGVLWGKWSREMNVKTRKLIEGGDKHSVHWKYLFVYWVNRSQLLELYYTHPFGKNTKKRKLIKEGNEWLKILAEDDPTSPGEGDEGFIQFIKKQLLLGGK